jgi:hypothetical protein
MLSLYHHWWPLAMPFISRRAQLNLTDEDTIWLERLAQSRTESAARVQRAQMVLRYAQGQTVSAIAAAFNTNRPKVERSVSKALEVGVRAANARSARTRPAAVDYGRGQDMGSRLGLPETQRSGLCAGAVDDAPAGQAHPEALCGGGTPEVAKAGTRDGWSLVRSLLLGTVRCGLSIRPSN